MTCVSEAETVLVVPSSSYNSDIPERIDLLPQPLYLCLAEGLSAMHRLVLLTLVWLPAGLCHAKTTTQPPPKYTIPCTMGNNAPCPTSWVCTPTQTCHTGTPCGGLCIGPPPTDVPCIVGDTKTPCPTGSTCTPTTFSTPGVPWSGECISTQPTPPSQTKCIVGNSGICGVGSVCTQTSTCFGACIALPTLPVPTSTSKHGRRRKCRCWYE